MHLPFRDREHAAAELAQALQRYRGRHPLVLAIPRGAVPMAAVIARALDGELDIVQVRKLGAPFNPELAMGAVDENGWRYLSPEFALFDIDAATVDRLAAREIERMHQRRRLWMGERAPIDAAGRTVIVVDDGLATGASMIAALHAVSARHPAHLVCAVAVAAPDSLERVRRHADDVVCLAAPAGFAAVGQYYLDFGQVEDEEVARILEASAERHGAGR
jgi:predicted phosphoribosyltransferase